MSAGPAHDAAGDIDCGGDTAGGAAGGADDGEGDAAVSAGVETPGIQLTGRRRKRPDRLAMPADQRRGAP